MLGWALAFFVAAIIAATFGFGAIASTFSGLALLLFYLFLGLLAITLVLSLFSKHAPSTGRSIRFISLLLIAGLIGVGVYAWQDHNMTAERVGRSIDHGTAELTHDAGNAVEEAANRTSNFVKTTAHNVQSDTAGALDDAHDTVAPNSNQRQTQDN